MATNASTNIQAGARSPRRKVDNSTMRDRKSTRLNSSHGYISYAVFCLKKKNENDETLTLAGEPDCCRFASEPGPRSLRWAPAGFPILFVPPLGPCRARASLLRPGVPV